MYDRASGRAPTGRDASAERAFPARAVAPAQPLLALQRSAGNAAVVQLMRQAAAPAAGGPLAHAAHASGGTCAVQRMHHPAKIDGEVRRLVAQSEPSIDQYIAEYDTWQTKRGNFKWISDPSNAELNDAFEVIEAMVDSPHGQSRADIMANLEAAIRKDVTTTSSETVATTRAAAIAAKFKLILGRKKDTDDWAEHQQRKPEGGDRLTEEDRLGRRLNTGKWSVPVNFAFMDGGIAERAAFKVVTSLGSTIETMLTGGQLHAGNFWKEIEKLGDSALWVSSKPADEGGPQAMLGHEILQLIESGYQFHGRESSYAQGNARLVAIHPDKPASSDVGNKKEPLTLR